MFIFLREVTSRNTFRVAAQEQHDRYSDKDAEKCWR